MKDKEKQIEFEERINCGIAYCEDTAIEEIKQDFKMQEEKHKQIEEIHSLLFCDKWEQPFTECPEDIKCIDCIARNLYEQGYRKLPEDSVLLSKAEYNEFLRQNFIIDELKDCVKLASKETAEKIIEELCMDGSTFTINRLTKLANKYDLDIREILRSCYGK